MELNKIYNEDCLIGMNKIPDSSIDMILCDLPYGTTNCSWDTIIPFEDLWKHYKRIIKDNGAIVLTTSQPFTSLVVTSNIEWFRHEWIWEKQKASNFMQAKKSPLKYHESVLVFSKKQAVYNPIKYKVVELEEITEFSKKELKEFMESRHYDFYGKIDKRKAVNDPKTNKEHLGNSVVRTRSKDDGTRYPKSVIKINKSINKNVHPTQKPVALFEYLIKTYTNDGDVVLDNCIGSGTTAVACINTGRSYIGFEKEKEYYDITMERIKNTMEVK